MGHISKELNHPYLIRANKVNINGMVYPSIYAFKGLTRIKYLTLLKCLDRYDCLEYYLLNILRIMGYPDLLGASEALRRGIKHKLKFFLDAYENPILPILDMSQPNYPPIWNFNMVDWHIVKRSYAGMISHLKFLKAFEYNNKLTSTV